MTVKRSLSIQGHRTSITLEAPFWERLNQVARAEGISAAELVARIDGERKPDVNLSSAIRVHLFEDVLDRLDRTAAKAGGHGAMDDSKEEGG